MSPTMTAFLLSFMCFASMNIGLTSGAGPRDVIFIIKQGSSSPETGAISSFLRDAGAALDIANMTQIAVIQPNNPPNALANLTFYATDIAFLDSLNFMSDNATNSVSASVLTAADLFRSSFRFSNCQTRRVLVVVTDTIGDNQLGTAALTMFENRIQDLQTNLDVITYIIQVGSTLDNSRIITIVTQGDATRHITATSFEVLDSVDEILAPRILALPPVSGCQCDPNPCKNGGTCIPVGTTRFFCRCVGTFVGKLCEFCSN